MGNELKSPYRLFKRGQTYHAYFSFYCQGQHIQFRESCRTIQLEEAKAYCDHRIAQIKAETTAEPRLDIDTAFARYFTEKGQYLARPKQCLSRLMKLKEDLAVTYLDEINETAINNFINLNRSKLSNSTINRYLFLISAVLTTAREAWDIKTSKVKPSKFKLKEPAENIMYLQNIDVLQRIIDKAAPHLKPIIITAVYTGLREGNLLKLKWENVDFGNKVINVKVKDKTKLGGKFHSVPMADIVVDTLRAIPQTSDYVFTYRGHPMTSIRSSWLAIFYKRRGREFTKELKDQSLPYIRFHGLRHTAATWILKATGNLKVTKEILGHSDISTTLKYAHVLDEQKRDAVNRLAQNLHNENQANQ